MTSVFLSGHYGNGYVVSPAVSYVEVGPAAQIEGGGLYASNALTLNNLGTVSTPGTTGISLAAGGTVDNQGTISGEIGVEAAAYAVLVNFTTIMGSDAAVDLKQLGTVENDGQIFGSVGLYGGLVENAGTVTGGVTVGNAGTVTNGSWRNTAALVGGATDGVALTAGGTVTNFGTLTGGVEGAFLGLASTASVVTNGSTLDRAALIEGQGGVDLANSTLRNFGTILGSTMAAVTSRYASTVVNGTLGDTRAELYGALGVYGSSALTLSNYGTIEGFAGDGLRLENGSTVVNGAQTDRLALIEGYAGVSLSGSGTMTNFGTILGTDPAYGPAVTFSGGGLVTNGDGADTAALISGVGGVALGTAGTVANLGTIDGQTGTAVLLAAGGTVINGSGADRRALIEGYAGVALRGKGSLANFGTIASTDGGGQEGVYLATGAALTNGAVTDTAALTEGYLGVNLAGNATVTNFGTIQGLGGHNSGGAFLVAGTLTNGSALDRAALVEGYTGVALGAAASLTNWGTIAGLGGTAVVLSAASDVLIDEAGAVFQGKVLGGGGKLVLAGAGGTLSGLGSSIAGFGLVVAQASAAWTLLGSAAVKSGSTLANDGTLTVAGALADGGLVEAAAGSLDLKGAVSGSGVLELAGSATLEADGAVGSNVRLAFAGTAETLVLTDPAAFKAGIAGFAKGDGIDLRGLASGSGETLSFVENAGNTQGTLKVTEGQTSFSVTLFGQYLASGFALASDGHGGSLLTYTPPGPVHAVLAAGG